jgi:hypothetical protein
MSNFKIRNYLRAKSEKRLRSLMYERQIQLKMASLEFDIIFANGYWFAWYYEILTTDTMETIVNDDTKVDRR